MDLTLPLAVLGFAVIVAAGGWLGSGRFDIFCGLLGTTPARPWPVGVQEADAPHFAVEHLAAAMGVAPLPDRADIDEEPAIEADVEIELVDLADSRPTDLARGPHVPLSPVRART